MGQFHDSCLDFLRSTQNLKTSSWFAHLPEDYLSLFNHFIDMSLTLMSPFFLSKNRFLNEKKPDFSTKNGLMSIK